MERTIYHRPRILSKCDKGVTIQIKSSPHRFFFAIRRMSQRQTKILKLNTQGPPNIQASLANFTQMAEEETLEGLYQDAPAGPQFVRDLFRNAQGESQGQKCVSCMNALKCRNAFTTAKDLIGAQFSTVD